MKMRLAGRSVLGTAAAVSTLIPAATLVHGQAASSMGTSALQIEVREATLGQLRDGVKWESVSIGPGGRRICYVTGKGAGFGWTMLQSLGVGKTGSVRMIVDGEESPEYVGVSPALFSPDGARVAYGAQSGTRMIDAVGRPLGRQQQFIVLDGKEGPPFDEVGAPVFSADGRRFAYKGRRDKEWFAVLDGNEGKPFEAVGDLVFSEDGRRLAYGAKRAGKVVVVLDGIEGAPHDGASRPVFSTDGARVAYIAHDGETSRLVDGEKATPVGHKGTGIVRSPDGARLAFMVEKAKGKKWSVVIDGAEGIDYDGVGRPVFAPDGKRCAYLAKRGKASLVVIDGSEGPSYDEIGMPVFSPDGRRFAHSAKRGKLWLVVVDGVAGPVHERVGQPVFSPDSRSVAFLVRDGKEERVVTDGTAGAAFDAIGVLSWSPDGRHLAYEARSGRSWRLVVDGTIGPEYGRLGELPEHELRQFFDGWTFDGPDSLFYVGRGAQSIVRWHAALRPPSP